MTRLSLIQFAGAFDRFNFSHRDVDNLLHKSVRATLNDEFVRECMVEAKQLATRPCDNPGFTSKNK